MLTQIVEGWFPLITNCMSTPKKLTEVATIKLGGQRAVDRTDIPEEEIRPG